MKCISTVALVALAAAPALTNALKHVVLSNGESRVLSAASSNSAKQDAGPKSKATTDSRPNVHNGGVNLYPYSADIQNYIVAAHNNARATLAPTSAANMRQVSWDESLAIEASELVNTCVFEHDTENYAYGQNLMYGGMTISTSVVDSWMDAWVTQEISPSDRAANGFMDLDHASAVLWANTYLVGCASKMCPNGYLTACNYYSPGNWQGEQTYIPGTPCSQCPSQAPYCDATGKLCVAEKPLSPTPAPTTPTSAPTPAPTTGAPAPTPAATTGSPIQQRPIQQGTTTPSAGNDQSSGNDKPTPSPTWTSDDASGSTVKTDSPVVQRPITSTPDATLAVETPAPTDKWGNFETSPATKPAMPGVIAALCGLLAIARAL